MSHVDHSAGSCVLCSVNNKLECNFDFVSNVLAADLVLAEAESAALLGGGRALTPADGANTVSAVLARRVAQGAALDLILVAGKGSASSAAVRVLGARDANIGHALGAVRRADAAANVVEALVALGVPERAPLLAVAALVHLAGTATISIRLVAVGTVIAEATVVRAVLPADGADSGEAILTVGVAKGAILLLIVSARGEGLSSSAAVGFLPAGVGHIGVVVVVMVVVDGCTVVVLLGVSERLLGLVGEVRHVLLILVVRVVALMSERVVVVTVETAVVVGAIIEVL